MNPHSDPKIQLSALASATQEFINQTEPDVDELDLYFKGMLAGLEHSSGDHYAVINGVKRWDHLNAWGDEDGEELAQALEDAI